jgi:alpha-L-fucosidase
MRDPRYADFYGPAAASPIGHISEAWHSRDWTPRPNAKFLEDWLARTCELVDKYQPQLVWFARYIGMEGPAEIRIGNPGFVVLGDHYHENPY